MLLTQDANPKEFLTLLKTILITVEQPDVKDPNQLLEESKQLSEDFLKQMVDNEGDRVLLKQSLVTFIGNLSCETQLRQMVAQDEGQLLSQILSMFKRDLTGQPFDWLESVNKYL